MNTRIVIGALALAGAAIFLGQMSVVARPADGPGLAPSAGAPVPARDGTGPDVIVGDLPATKKWATVSGLTAYSIGTTSCNVGDETLDWHRSPDDRHPVIGQNMFRLKDGRLEHLGQAWLKHSFCALQQGLCGECSGKSGCLDVLHPGCSDPYSANRNGLQSGLGPKWQVDPHTGSFDLPWHEGEGTTGDLRRRLLVRNEDLGDPDATYFIEGQYVTKDDAAAGNQNNNVSYRAATIDESYNITLVGPTKRREPAIHGWQWYESSVRLVHVQVDEDGERDAETGLYEDGLFIVGYHVVDNGDGTWSYEYAVYNMNSHRGARAFAVPVSGEVTVSDIGFHDVDYHSGDGPGGVDYDGTDWSVATDGSVAWFTERFEDNESANALRWGTLYNFRFVADAGPVPGAASLDLFRPDEANPDFDTVTFEIDVPGVLACLGDIDGSGAVDTADLVLVLAAWGNPGGPEGSRRQRHGGGQGSHHRAVRVGAVLRRCLTTLRASDRIPDSPLTIDQLTNGQRGTGNPDGRPSTSGRGSRHRRSSGAVKQNPGTPLEVAWASRPALARRRTIGHVIIGVLLSAAAAGCERSPAPSARAQPGAPASRADAPPSAIEAEVLANIRRQAAGERTVADDHLPERLLRRMAARIIRESYQDTFHVVYTDAAAADTPPWTPPEGGGPARVRVVRAELPEPVRARRRAHVEGRPVRRGFAAPILDGAADPMPRASDAASRAAATIVARRLARDGLLPTLAAAVEALGPEAVRADPAAAATRLRGAGLPVDLLAHFRLREGTGAGPRSPRGAIVDVAERLAAGASAAALAPALRAVPFGFTPTRPGFRVASESGDETIALLRVQGTRGSYWNRPGSGGSLDVVRQLFRSLPDVDFVMSIEERFLPPFLEAAGRWTPDVDRRLTVIAEPLVVAQWAQDNGKAGFVPADDAAGRRWATLVPRFASRRDDGSVFVPGESFLVDGLAAAGLDVVHSPLLFQGGNLIAVRDPEAAELVLLVGEAEVHRNTALGLTAAEAVRALQVELGVDRCVVLPSVSFHIDYDVTVRGHGGQPVAFVNDPLAAARVVVALAIDALAARGELTEEEQAAAARHLAARRGHALHDVVGAALARRADARRHYPLSLAQVFADGPADAPAANLRRVLASLDLLASADDTGAPGPSDPRVRAYLDAFRRTEADRAVLHELLREQGWRVVPVPSLPEAARGLCAINGIQDRHRYLMPAYGGFFAPLDRAAAGVFAEALGPEVAIVPILCGESQRRSGAVHCAASAYPRP